LGLSIISQIMQEMNGHLKIEKSPTRFSISLRRLN
jgi:C4-dicarboxylate-specific signal transduction histidine kinase